MNVYSINCRVPDGSPLRLMIMARESSVLTLRLTAVIALQYLFSVTLGEEGCIRDYHRLESELVNNDLNLDSLTRSFFPPNTPSVPVVEVFYTISNSSDPNQHPLILEIQGVLNETELAVLAKYRYRWSETPIYLFMDPSILRSNPARLVITNPLCDNYTINGIPLPQYHLNQMTSLLKVYAYKRKSVEDQGLDIGDQQGYVSFFNDTDFRVIGYDTNYTENLFLLIFGLVALASFITTATPLLINAQYDSIYKLAGEQHKHTIFLIWATAIVCFGVTITILVIDVYLLFIERLMIPNIPARWIYYLSIAMTGVFLLFDLLLTIFVKKKKDFPLPYLLKLVFCQTCCKSTIVAQTLAIWSAIVFMQLASFHLTFIFLAFVASPVQTGSTFLLFVTGLLSGISLTTLFLAVFQKRLSPIMTTAQKKLITHSYFLKSLYFLLFIFILVFTLFFATCFIRITIYVGDIQSGGIPSLIATLAPSALLAGMGYLGKKVLENYVPRGAIKKDNTGESIGSDSPPNDVTDDVTNTSSTGGSTTELTSLRQRSDKIVDEHNMV